MTPFSAQLMLMMYGLMRLLLLFVDFFGVFVLFMEI